MLALWCGINSLALLVLFVKLLDLTASRGCSCVPSAPVASVPAPDAPEAVYGLHKPSDEARESARIARETLKAATR